MQQRKNDHCSDLNFSFVFNIKCFFFIKRTITNVFEKEWKIGACDANFILLMNYNHLSLDDFDTLRKSQS